MGIVVTLRDIIAIGILLICVIGFGILYARMKWEQWRSKRKDAKMAKAKKAAATKLNAQP